MLFVTLSVVCFSVALFAALFPVNVDYYSLQRFVFCAVIWLAAWIPLIEKRRRGESGGKYSVLLWFAPLLVSFLSGELYGATYRVEPLMFFFFFFAAIVFGGRLAQSVCFELTVARFLNVAALSSFVYALVALMNYSFALLEGLEDFDFALAWGVPNIRYWSHLATWVIP